MSGAYYEIVVRGRVRAALATWCPALEIRTKGRDTTELFGWIADQAALQGLINSIGDLGLDLLSVREITEPR